MQKFSLSLIVVLLGSLIIPVTSAKASDREDNSTTVLLELAEMSSPALKPPPLHMGREQRYAGRCSRD